MPVQLTQVPDELTVNPLLQVAHELSAEHSIQLLTLQLIHILPNELTTNGDIHD
jgi:hypothetical protein